MLDEVHIIRARGWAWRNGQLAFLAWLVLWVVASARDYPLLSRSLHWAPYAYDASTVSLHHFDEKVKRAEEPAGGGDVDELVPDVGEAAAGPGETRSAPGNSAANANPSGRAAVLLGGCELVPDGRFGGGIRFPGGRGMLVGSDVGRLDARTIEFWARVEELPKTPATLIHFFLDPERARRSRIDNPGPVVLRLNPTGSLQLVLRGQELPATEVQCRAGQWVHIALSWSCLWPHAEQAFLSVNGKRVFHHRFRFHLGPECSLGAFVFGNDPEGKSGFRGLADEVRLSSVVREFYEYDLDWVRSRRGADLPSGQPFFRDPADLVFRVDFNKTVRPQVGPVGLASPDYAVSEAEEGLQPDKARQIYPDGVDGRGFRIGDGQPAVSYSGKGILPTARGTIAFWMQPVDWDNYTRDDRLDTIPPTQINIFSVNGEHPKGSYQRVFRRSGHLMAFTIRAHMDESVDDPVDLAPGQWVHIAVTWEGTRFTDYVNGRARPSGGAWSIDLDLRSADDPDPQKKDPRWWTEAVPESLAFSSPQYPPKSPVPHTVIDDFRIYRRPLSPSEIANLAALHDPRKERKPLPDADMTMTYNGVKGEVQVGLTPLIQEYGEARRATVEVVKETETKPVGTASFEFDENRQGQTTVRTPPLEFAAYQVHTRIEDRNGRVLGRASRAFTRTPPPWWESKAGLSDRVMPEWTPMKVVGRIVSLWGREIHIAPSGLPERILSAGEDVLAGPVSLTASVDGKPIPMQAASDAPEFVSVQDVRVGARGKLAGGKISASIDSYTEFDGMMWLEIALASQPQSTASLDSLQLRIPYRPESAVLVHWWSGNRNFRDPKNVHFGEVPTADGVVFRSNDHAILNPLPDLRGSFIPYVMLTGDVRGMAWFAENDQGWTPSTQTPAVTIERRAGAVTLVLNVITERVSLAEPRRLAFGLHPIPVKPLEKHWRRRKPGYTNVMPDTFCGNNLKGRKGPTGFSIYPEDDWDAVNRRIQGEGRTKGAAGLLELWNAQLKPFRELGREPLPVELEVPGLYWDLQWSGPHPEHTREWAETWGLGYGDFQHYTPEFVRYASWAWSEWVTKTNRFIQGAYMDDCWGADQHAWPGPVSYRLPDGHVQPGFQFRGWRERIKRMRQILWENGIAPHLTAHTTHTLFIPYHSFFDLICDGEDKYCAPPDQRDFIDSWDLARMRFMNNRKWGLMTTWLGFHGNSLDPDKHPAWYFRQKRAYDGFMAAHDIVWGFDPKVLDGFGWGEPDVEFVPWWALGGLVEHRHEFLTVSAWKRPGKGMLLLLNRGPDRLDAAVRVHRQAMGLGEGDPDQVTVRDVDPTLLTYFKIDLTTLETPKEIKISESGKVDLKEMNEEEDKDDVTREGDDPEKLPLEERRAKDPDGRFSWKDGQLSCPIRRHDYRLFEFR